MENKKLSLNFDTTSAIQEFIQTTESGIYDGHNVEGNYVIVIVEKGKGLIVKTLQPNGWYVVHDYGEFGNLEGETYEK